MAYPYKLYGGATRPDAISGLDPRFDQALLALYQNAPPEVQAELALNSAYRSNIVQQSLWNQSDKTGHSVARPGHSQHEKGRAADLYGFGLTRGNHQVSQATKDWVHQNAGKFGLNFPMQHEPWHIQMAAQMQQTPEGQQATAQMQQAGYTPEQIQKAFLSTIASGESPGYDVMYGGQKFTDFSRHPHQMQPILDKQGNVTGHADVAGRYQFKGSTWDEEAKKYGYKDFSPETQDRAAWNYANEIYGKKTGGGSLEEALKSGDPARINAAAQVLNQTWTSLPGGAEQGKGYGNKSFYDIYNQNLGGTAVASDSPSEGGSRFGGTGLGNSAPKVADKSNWIKDAFGGLGKTAGTGNVATPPVPALPDLPKAALAAAQAGPGIDPNQGMAQRQRLAEAMMKLNAGKLWV